MDVLSLESIEKLTKHVTDNPNCQMVADEFEELSERLSLQYVAISYEIQLDGVSLALPDSKSDRKLSDAENVKILYGALSDLTPAQATDERLWTTLLLHYFQEYTKVRWWDENLEKNPPRKQYKAHWLCGTSSRARQRDHSIARLWWMGYFASRLEGADIDDVTKVLFNNSDYRASLLERTTSTGASNVLRAIVEITREAFDEGLEYERQKTREFMKQVNFIAGRTNLSALTDVQLIKLLKPVYREVYFSSAKASKGIVDKFKGFVVGS